MAFKIYKTDTRIDNKTKVTKDFECFADAEYKFSKMVEQFKYKGYKGKTINDSLKRFTFEFNTGDKVDLILLNS